MIDVISVAKKCFQDEADAILNLIPKLDENFTQAIEIMMSYGCTEVIKTAILFDEPLFMHQYSEQPVTLRKLYVDPAFYHRKTGEALKIDDIPDVIFSEVMRDVDMAVSVAHVGGVDPEASHSTVEMRVAIVAELAKLLKLSNVSWIGSHAKIQGKLASYSVHMGSGVVHAEGVGMVSILPVHSQSRGRIFLPFADDDPKTAEIMSKILLLSEDSKIKDPTILSQISY